MKDWQRFNNFVAVQPEDREVIELAKEFGAETKALIGLDAEEHLVLFFKDFSALLFLKKTYVSRFMPQVHVPNGLQLPIDDFEIVMENLEQGWSHGFTTLEIFEAMQGNLGEFLNSIVPFLNMEDAEDQKILQALEEASNQPIH